MNENIFNCVIDSINNIINNGMDYYRDKDINLYNKIASIKIYVNKYRILNKNIKFSYNKKDINDNYLDSILKIKESILNYK